MVGLSSLLSILAFTIYTSEANYNFTIRFYEFRNPLGLQCDNCESGGPPACCDEGGTGSDCRNNAPFNCDTRFRFLLRPFGASVETAPTGGFALYTTSHGGNSHTFTEGPGGFLALANPFTIVNTSEWTGKVQFFIDALDRAVRTSNLTETEVIINRFPIDLELELGAGFTEKTNYTGTYSIPDMEFDMSFRVQCSENYYGPNCTAHCDGVYTCDGEGKPTCLTDNQTSTTFCTQCLSSWNPSPICAMCLDLSTNCTACRDRNYDPSTNCTTCLEFLDQQTNCTKCIHSGYDPASSCTTCLPDFIKVDSSCSRREEITEELITSATTSNHTSMIVYTETLDHNNIIDHTDGGLNLALVGGVAGGVLAALVVIIILTLCVLVVVVQKRKRTKYDAADATSCLSVDGSSTYTKKTTSGGSNTPQHDFKNPLYGPASAPPATAGTTNGEQYPLEQLLEVPNPFYGEFTDSTSQVGSKPGSRTSLNKEDATAPRSRLDTFPYEMDRADDTVSTASTINRQQRERIEPVVYEMADVVSEKPSMKVENSMYDTADNVCGEPSKVENNMYDTADNVCGKPSKIENNMYDTADNVCGRPVSADNGVPLGVEYDDIKTGGAAAATYDDIVVPSGKKSAGVNKVNGDNMSAAVYDDILTSNRDIKVATETQALYDDVIKTSKSPSVPTATGSNDEYDDVIKGPGKPSSGTAAKLMSDSGEGAQPFDNEVYSAPYPNPNS